jgi:hypothetical protein
MAINTSNTPSFRKEAKPPAQVVRYYM